MTPFRIWTLAICVFGLILIWACSGPDGGTDDDATRDAQAWAGKCWTGNEPWGPYQNEEACAMAAGLTRLLCLECCEFRGDAVQCGQSCEVNAHHMLIECSVYGPADND